MERAYNIITRVNLFSSLACTHVHCTAPSWVPGSQSMLLPADVPSLARHPRCQAHPDCGCQAQAHRPWYQAYRPQCQAGHTIPVVPDAPSRVSGLPSPVLGLPYPVVPDTPSQVPGLPSPVPGSRSMLLPADVPSLALDDHTASTVSGASQGRGSPACVQTGCVSPRAGCRRSILHS